MGSNVVQQVLIKLHQRNVDGLAAVRNSANAEAEPVAEAGVGGQV